MTGRRKKGYTMRNQVKFSTFDPPFFPMAPSLCGNLRDEALRASFLKAAARRAISECPNGSRLFAALCAQCDCLRTWNEQNRSHGRKEEASVRKDGRRRQRTSTRVRVVTFGLFEPQLISAHPSQRKKTDSSWAARLSIRRSSIFVLSRCYV